MSIDFTARRTLALQLGENDSGATTVRGYLVELIKVAWEEKRPFGNSGWHYDLYEPMVRAGLIAGEFDEDDYLKSYDRAEGERLIFAAIDALNAKPLADAMIDAVELDGTHHYWSTHCRHGNHDACSADTIQGRLLGDDARLSSALAEVERKPAQCKTCGAPCLCPCGHGLKEGQ